MSLFDHPLISQRYFFPRPNTVPKTFPVHCDGATLHCIYAPLPTAKKTVVYFHGNGETVADYYPDFIELFHKMGLGIFLCEYRGYGSSTGTPQMAKMLEDTKYIFESLNLPASQLILFGRSVGSIYAIEFARRHPQIAGLIIESGIAVPLQRILLRIHPEEIGTSLQALKQEADIRFNHKKVMEQYQNPLLILHAKQDNLVTPDHAQHLYDWSKSPQKELVMFPHGNHNSIFMANVNEYIQKLIQFFALVQ